MSAATIGEAWASYREQVVPREAHAVQIEETKRAFYAGAAAMFGAMLEAVKPEEEEACEGRLEALDRELSDYLRIFSSVNRV